jgi:Domain of unknown function (DUF4032)/Lipopolysaccharide kinase (Kdo/WaaP) family
MPPRFQLVARTGHPDFLDLPWDRPLEELESERLVSVVRGIGRHVVRFVDYDGTLYALKELPTELAWREYRLLLRLRAAGIPVVEAVGVAAQRGGELEAVLITRHLEYSLPFRALFGRGIVADLRQRLLDASAELLVRLHVSGFFWGDCSLSNTLFRRDAGALAAYLVDAETGELHPALTDGQRRHDLAIACENFLGELLDVAAEFDYPLEQEPEETAEQLAARYERLWDELIHEEVFGPDERFRVDERLRRLNELGFDVEELELVGDADVYRLRLNPRVVEPGHHRRRLLELTGLRAQENQARRMLNDLATFRADLEKREGRPLPSSVITARWLEEVFESAIAAVPSELFGKREAAEIFHEILDHRWYLSQDAGRDVGLLPAVESYVERVLRHAPDERALLERDLEPEPT